MQETIETQNAQKAAIVALEMEKKKKILSATSTSEISQIDFVGYGQRAVSFLARNFYNLKYVALVLAFCINFMLLFYKVSDVTNDLAVPVENDGVNGGSGDGEDEILEEFVHVDEDFFYMEHVMRIAAMLHSTVSLAMLVAYYHLKVPLAIFKREKEIARTVEFDGLYITEQPTENDVKSHWDKLVISAKSFPVNYWDKFVKKKVRQKYSETYDFEAISNLLGMEKTSFTQQDAEENKGYFNLFDDQFYDLQLKLQIYFNCELVEISVSLKSKFLTDA